MRKVVGARVLRACVAIVLAASLDGGTTSVRGQGANRSSPAQAVISKQDPSDYPVVLLNKDLFASLSESIQQQVDTVGVNYFVAILGDGRAVLVTPEGQDWNGIDKAEEFSQFMAGTGGYFATNFDFLIQGSTKTGSCHMNPDGTRHCKAHISP